MNNKCNDIDDSIKLNQLFEDNTQILWLHTIRSWFQRGVLNSQKPLVLQQFAVNADRIDIEFTSNKIDYTLIIPMDEEEFILNYTTAAGNFISVTFTAEKIIKGRFPT